MLLEALPQHPGDVVQQEAERWWIIRHGTSL
jgi:hypothetical protein